MLGQNGTIGKVGILAIYMTSFCYWLLLAKQVTGWISLKRSKQEA